MLLGSQFNIGSTKYEVTSVYRNGQYRIRPANKQNQTSNRQFWSIGEICRIVNTDADNDLIGEVISVVPLKAVVKGNRRWNGTEVTQSHIRKVKA